MWLIGDLQSDLVNDLRCPNLDAMCSRLKLELCWLTDLRCGDGDAWSVCWLVLQCWLRCSVDVFVFRFALVISNLVAWGLWFSDLQCILGFGFFFFENLWVCFTRLPSVGSFFCLDWVCFTFRIDVGIFCGLALLQIYIYIYFQILVQNFFGLFFLLESRINFLFI